MAYDPDKQRHLNITLSSRVFQEDDRQAPYDEIYEVLVEHFGVTRVGDVLTVRSTDWDATFILHEVKLKRDREDPDEGWHA